MTRRRRLLLFALSLFVAACSTGATPSPGSPAPATSAAASGSIAPSGSAAGALSQAQLRVRLIDRLGPLWYCDPDFYPVARDDEAALAVKNWAQVVADPEALAAIEAQLGIKGGATPSDTDKLAVYHEWKMLRAITLDPAGTGRWRFDYLAQPVSPSSGTGSRSTGTIDAGGSIAIESSAPGRAPNCPICLARGTAIDTPLGPVAVEALRVGDPVWTLDGGGERVVGVVAALGSMAAPAGHHVIRLLLADGRSLLASPGHPLADGRRLGDLRAGDTVDGSTVAAADLVPYAGDRTFDLLASDPTGAYSAGGVWLGSTLRP